MRVPAKPLFDIQSFVCARCHLRQHIRDVQSLRKQHVRWNSSSTQPASAPGKIQYPAHSQRPAYVHLTNRALISLQGPDVLEFLNGLLPARLLPLSESTATPIFTAFLSAKGRILYETFIYPPDKSRTEAQWFIEVARTSLSAVFSHLKKHKLRSKFKLEKVSAEDLKVYYRWPTDGGEITKEPGVGGQDPRPLMGIRFISGPSDQSPLLSSLQENGAEQPLLAYHIHRITNGHAEGSTELISNSALPQESNIDFDGGIDFHKGCYLGQELTIRTHHTGVVRKRILPCQIYPANSQLDPEIQAPVYDNSVSLQPPPPESNISKMHAKGRSGRSTGKWLGGVGNIGLALCRLETMADIHLTAEGTNFEPDGEFAVVWEEGIADAEGKSTLHEVKVKPFVPRWLRDKIQAGINARSERSKKRRQDEDDDEEDVE